MYDYPVKGYSQEEIVHILCDPMLKKEFICSSHPVSVENNVSFVIDVSELKNPNDVRADDLGSWKCTGSRVLRFSVKITSRSCSLVTCSSPGAIEIGVRRQYFVHATDNDLHRMIAFLENEPTQDNVSILYIISFIQFLLADKIPKSHCLVQYWFNSGREHKVIIKPHGNSKQKQPYCRTNPSTMAMIKQESKNGGPKDTVCKVYNKQGGMMGAKSLGELPRNRAQVANMRRSNDTTASLCSKKSLRDPLFMVMEQCKLQDGKDKFVRTVTACPESMCLLATDQQLNDLVRFCTNPNEFCVLSIDPIFSLGDFSVTCITYRSILVTDMRTGQSPIMLGPLFIHQSKSYEVYNFFASALTGITPSLARILAFGTDWEQALVKAFKQQFCFALHLRCFRHMRQDIQRKANGWVVLYSCHFN